MWDTLYAIALKAAHDICKVPNMKTNHTKTSSPSFIPFFFSSTTHAFSFSLSRFSLRRHNDQLSCFAIDFLSCRVIGAPSRTRVEPVTVVCTLYTYLKPPYNSIALCCSSSVAFWNEVCIWFLPPLQACTNALLLLRTYFLNVTQASIGSCALHHWKRGYTVSVPHAARTTNNHSNGTRIG